MLTIGHMLLYGSFAQNISLMLYMLKEQGIYPVSNSFSYLKFTYKQKILHSIKCPSPMHNQFNENCKILKKSPSCECKNDKMVIT